MTSNSAAEADYEIDIRIEDDCWLDADGDLNSIAKTALAAIYKHINVRPFSEVSVAMLTNERVQALNKQYRGKDKPTNVLSFPASADGSCPLLGDIVLAAGIVQAEAKSKRASLENHVSHLLIHGFLHLQGYDHETEGEAKAMEAREIKALADLGIVDPYARDDES